MDASQRSALLHPLFKGSDPTFCRALHTSSSGEERPEPYNATINCIPCMRRDELQGLLADSSDNERGATLLLHSNPRRRGGGGGRKRKSKTGASGKPRRMTLFGFERPPIQLPDDGAEDKDDALLFRRHHNSSGSASTPTTTLTTIWDIPVSKATGAAQAEAKSLKEKEERRQRRKVRKEMKRLVEAGVVGDGEEFEGFQGNGGLALLNRPSGAGGGTTATSLSVSHSRSHSRCQSQQSREGFGHLVSAPPPAAEDDDEDTDIEGGLYAHQKSKSGTHSNEGALDLRRIRSSLSQPSASASD